MPKTKYPAELIYLSNDDLMSNFMKLDDNEVYVYFTNKIFPNIAHYNQFQHKFWNLAIYELFKKYTDERVYNGLLTYLRRNNHFFGIQLKLIRQNIIKQFVKRNKKNRRIKWKFTE